MFYHCSKDKIPTGLKSDISLLPILPTGRTLFPPSLKHDSWHQLFFSGCVNEIGSEETDIKAGKKDPVKSLDWAVCVFVCFVYACVIYFLSLLSLLEGRR